MGFGSTTDGVVPKDVSNGIWCNHESRRRAGGCSNWTKNPNGHWGYATWKEYLLKIGVVSKFLKDECVFVAYIIEEFFVVEKMRMRVKNLLRHAFSHGIGKLLEFCKSYDPGGRYYFMTNSFVFGSHSSRCQGRVTKISLGLIVAPSKFPMIQNTNHQKIYRQTTFHS